MNATPTDWIPLRAIGIITPPVLGEILGGGQSFTWAEVSGEPGTWSGTWGRHAAQLRTSDSGLVEYRIPNPATTFRDLERYLAVDADFAGLTDALPWRSDPVLHQAIRKWSGLRILRQPPAEALLGFLLSSTKAIPQIAQLCRALARSFGEPIDNRFHALPTWEALAEVPETGIRELGCGFRSRYLAGTARFLAENPGWLSSLEEKPTEEARECLLQLPGVGRKVADCVLLFGYGRIEAFPVDTWILKVLQREYALEGWTPAQLLHFARIHFGPAAGLAQQYLFAHARKRARHD